MPKEDPKDKGPRKHDDSPGKPPSDEEQSKAIAESSDEDDPEPDKARDRQPKPEDVD